MKMLSWSGIDTNLFKTHSLRAASTSKVSCWGLQMKDILSNGNWSNESTWQKFYHKKISSPSERFQNALLSGNTPPQTALKEDLPTRSQSLES